jgi:restriction endonuclease Mrr
MAAGTMIWNIVPIPDYQTLMRPFLAAHNDGQEHSVADVRTHLADEFGLTDEGARRRFRAARTQNGTTAWDGRRRTCTGQGCSSVRADRSIGSRIAVDGPSNSILNGSTTTSSANSTSFASSGSARHQAIVPTRRLRPPPRRAALDRRRTRRPRNASMPRTDEDVPLVVELRGGDPVSELSQACEAATSGAAVATVA